MGCLLLWNTRQKVTLVNPGTGLQSRNHSAALAQIGSDRMVMLCVDEFGDSAYAPVGADELSYEEFHLIKGILSRDESNNNTPLVISRYTKAAINLEQNTSAFNAASHPLLIDRIPWTYTTRGVPMWTDHYRLHPWLCHKVSITGIANDGTVTVAAAGKQFLLKPGGEVRVMRSLGLWSSSLTIHHNGVFNKDKIKQSKWLIVECK